MILRPVPLGTLAYRAHTPRWAYQPLSGAGAAVAGGRFNRPGIEALYLSFEQQTALAEYQQTSPVLPPSLICSYLVVQGGLVDLHQLHKGAPWDDLWHDWTEDWRALWFDQHIEPPTWVLSDMVRDAGYTGIIFPSVAHQGGSNLVLYPDKFGPGDQVDVMDDDKLLPQNQQSWAAPAP